MAYLLNAVSRGAGGTAVLFVHSFAGDLSHWTAQLEHLQTKRRVVAFDLSGHGASSAAVGRYTIRELVKDIGTVGGAQNLQSFILVGHSLGAAIAAEYAGSHPQTVKALILVDAPPAPGAISPEQVRKLRSALAHDPYTTIEQFWNQQMFTDSRPEVQRKLLASLLKISRSAAISLTEDLFSHDSTVALRRYPGPKFAIVTPRNDAPLSLHNAVPGIERVVVQGTGHWIQLDKPDEFNRVLDIFLSELARR
jgi:pimeloyl-ACP methyl ester carboxylesterase